LDIIVHPGAVAILPVDDHGNIYFVNQYRHATGGMLLEIPAGKLDQNESPEDCAQRELREEIGMGAREMKKIGEYYLLPAYSTQKMHIFLANKLFNETLPGDEDEDLTIVKMAKSDVLNKLKSGEFSDAKSIIALYNYFEASI